MLYIIWLTVGGAIHFITVAKSKMCGMAVKITPPGLTFFSAAIEQSLDASFDLQDFRRAVL